MADESRLPLSFPLSPVYATSSPSHSSLMEDLTSEKRLLLDELMDRGLATARMVVGGLRQAGMGSEMELLTAEAGKALRELDTAIQVDDDMMKVMVRANVRGAATDPRLICGANERWTGIDIHRHLAVLVESQPR